MTAANRSKKGELATAALIHEMQGRVASIAMFSDELAINDQRHESTYLDKRLRQIRRAAAELQQIFDTVRRLDDDTPPVRTTVDVAAIAKGIFHSHVERVPAFRSATVVVQSHMQLVGAPAEVAILLENLIGNALKFSVIRPVPVVRVSADARADRTVVHVSDNGVGIAPEDEIRRFEPFTRCHARFEGSGLGLAIAKRIVERHGGEIWARGALDLGTTVSFHF